MRTRLIETVQIEGKWYHEYHEEEKAEEEVHDAHIHKETVKIEGKWYHEDVKVTKVEVEKEKDGT